RLSGQSTGKPEKGSTGASPGAISPSWAETYSSSRYRGSNHAQEWKRQFLLRRANSLQECDRPTRSRRNLFNPDAVPHGHEPQHAWIHGGDRALPLPGVSPPLPGAVRKGNSARRCNLAPGSNGKARRSLLVLAASDSGVDGGL